jgi:putative transposase
LKPSRSKSPPGTYFITFSTFQRMRLFVVEPYVRLFLKTLYTYQRQGAFQLHAFVVMPEHVHLLITPAPEKTLERVVQLIKGGYSRDFGLHFGLKKEVWQRGFTDHRIRDAQDFEIHRGYIHHNPVKRGLVENPVEYRYCSAFPGFRLDIWPSAAKAA